VSAEGAEGAAEGEVVLVYLVRSRKRSNFPASSRDSPHTPHWLPNLHTSDCYQCMALALAEEEEVVRVDLSRHRSSDDSFPSSSRGSPRILHWRPIQGTSDHHRSTKPEGAAEGAAEGEVVLVVKSRPCSSADSLPA